jgi:acetate---CoA ligase (ADP-forming)
MTTYPAHLEADVVMRTGRTLRLRPIRPDDHLQIVRFYGTLSPESMYMRFFGMRSAEAAAQGSPSNVDYRHEFGIVGELGGEVVAVAHYLSMKKRPDVAEVAFAIRDDMQGHGIGTRMLERLAEVAFTNGIVRFEAETLSENALMLDVFLRCGFDVVSRSGDGVVRVAFPIAPTPHFESCSAERAQKAAHASMKSVFEPRSIAVVGVSHREGHLGNSILSNLKKSGFTGRLHALGRGDSLHDIKEPVDLVVIVVPAAQVESVIDDCIAIGVSAVVVITAGFGETGPEGQVLEQRLVDKVRSAGIRMVGPNCMGVINTDPAIGMQATFAPVFPPAGNIGMSSQSGALGLAILDYARNLNIGFSTFVSVGNKADVSGNDLIQYWAEDPKTRVILLYLESFGNPRKFAQIARRVGKQKPIAIVKGGRSASGARAASSHTGALATDDKIVADMLRQAGVIRTDTLEGLFDVASLLAHQPPPRGRRVAIVTNAGGPGILAADACEANGLELATLSDATKAHMRTFLPAAASVNNPVDMIASASADQYRNALKAVVADEAVDAVIAIYIPVLPTDAPQVAQAIRETESKGKTLVATFMGAQGVPAPLAPVPAFAFPERAVNALAAAAKYGEWREEEIGSVVEFDDIDGRALRTVIEGKIASGGGWLTPEEMRSLFTAAKVNVVPTTLVDSAARAVEVADQFGYPVVLKADGPELLHKSDVGGVRLSLGSRDAVHEAFEQMKATIGDRMTGAVVQKMIKGGVEMMVGVNTDPHFGHLIAYGAGGTMVELLADVAFRIHPLTDGDIDEMLQQVRATKLLAGFRGKPPADAVALKETIGRISAMISICPEIRELDINPLIVQEHGAVAVDGRVKVERVVPPPPSRRVTY